TTDTVGAGQTLSAAVRDSRAAQAIYTQDLSAVAEDAPFMALRSMTTLAFRNRADEMDDRDYSSAGTVAQQQAAIATSDINGNGVEGETGIAGEISRATDISNRNHRTDIFSFFSRSLERRQTGNDGTYAADMSSNE